MLKLSDALIGLNVMSLRTGGPVGIARSMIINPDNLKIEGWYVEDKFNGNLLVLLSDVVRDLVPQGIAINDSEDMVDPEELIRLKPIMEINFQLPGKKVVSVNGKSYGKVSDFAVETSSMLVKKIYCSQAIVKSLSGGSLSIDRTQIREITNTTIVIDDADEKLTAGAASQVVAG